MGNMELENDDFSINPTSRVPVCLVLDTSGSMSVNSAIDELNNGVQMFFDAVKSDELARYSAEITIVTFGGIASTILDFNMIDKQTPPPLRANGRTPMGEAVNIALDLLEERKEKYKTAGIDYYQPWLVLMTDGEPTDSIDSAAKRCCDLINEKKLTIFPIGIGNQADMDVLRNFSPKRDPLKLKGMNFKEFFEWLGKSVNRVSNSNPTDSVPLDIEEVLRVPMREGKWNAIR